MYYIQMDAAHKISRAVPPVLMTAAVALFLSVLSCAKLDVVGTGSVKAFGEVLQTIPAAVTADTATGGWSLGAPDGGARFIWNGSLALELDAAPFLAAGLDPNKLAGGIVYAPGKLSVTTTFSGDNPDGSDTPATPLSAYERIVRRHRSVVGYHGALDHYGVSIGTGNLFEWAKDLRVNDKDIVFVLDPAPFIAAGVDVAGIQGWVFAKVTVDDETGKPVEVDKLLKPFDL